MGPVRFAAFGLALLAFVAAAAVMCGACSSGASPCDSSQCAEGNRCLSVAGAATQCERPCATHTDCPYNYHCDPNASGTSPYCVINTTTFPDTPTTQFGASCSPTGGFQNNPDCDGTLGFWCNAKSPLDANAYCTLFGCKVDTDCGGGYYCGRENQLPNAASGALQDGQTYAVCLPRGYCAPCSTDIDWAPTNGAPQHCIAGTDGARFCAPECNDASQCALDATCAPQTNYRACAPRAGVCKGDGTLCAPCRSDADCTGGYCVPAYNSPEHFCTTKSGIACSYSSTLQIIDQCPSSTAATPVVGCSVTSVEPNMPPDQCIGQVRDGVDDTGAPTYVEGCWTVR